MLTCIGGILFESIDSKLDIFKLTSVYVSSLTDKLYADVKDIIKDSEIPDIEFKSIGIKFSKHSKTLYEISSQSTNKQIAEVLGKYRLVSFPDVSISVEQAQDIIAEAFDERDSNGGLPFEIVSVLCKYCEKTIYNKIISGVNIEQEIALDDFGVSCVYTGSKLKIKVADKETADRSGAAELVGSYAIGLKITASVICSLEPSVD